MLFAALLLTAIATTAHAAPPEIPLYHATYSVGRNDLRIGTAQFSLKHDHNGSYTYQSVTKATGLAALFFSDVITETSHFTLVDGKPRSLLYSYVHSGGDHDRPQNIRFDWSKQLAYSDDGNEHRTLPLKPGMYDRLLTQLLISLDAAQGKATNTYHVLDHGELRTYHLQTTENATLKTPAGEYQTIEVTRHDAKKNRTTSFWLAPKLDYLPVQMQQTEPGKATISLVLTEIHFDTRNSK